MRGIWGMVARHRRAPDTTVLRAVVLAIAVVQALVLGLLARRGSWLSDDLDFMVQGSRGFSPGELLTPVNDHIAPGLRFAYAIFAQLAPLNWDFTIAWRVLMQALAIALMGLLLLRLLGSSWWVVIGTVFYALSPLSMPSFMSLSSGVNNLSAHVFGLLLLHATLDWYAGHRRRAIAYGPLSLLITLACWEKSGLILVTAIALALYVRELPLRRWLRQTWPFAVALAVPVVAFGLLYLTQGNPSAGALPGFTELLELGARSFAIPLDGLVGGPWTWSTDTAPFGLAEPPWVAIALGGLITLLLLFAAWREDRRALLLWGSIAIYTLVTLLLVSYGRFAVFGGTFTRHYHYWSDLSIPLTLAAVLTARSAFASRAVRTRVTLLRAVPLVVLSGLLAWTSGAVVSAAGFARIWDNNPSGPYFDTVTAELDKAGPSVNLWDTQMPPGITSGLAADQRLSPVLRMAGIPFQLQAAGTTPYIIDADGRLRTADLSVWSRAVLPPKPQKDPICGDGPILHGATTLTMPLKTTLPTVGAANWYAKIGYLSNVETRLQLELLDHSGNAVAMPEPSGAWPASVGSMYYGPSPRTEAAFIRLRTTDPSTNLCVAVIDVGLPKVSG